MFAAIYLAFENEPMGEKNDICNLFWYSKSTERYLNLSILRFSKNLFFFFGINVFYKMNELRHVDLELKKKNQTKKLVVLFLFVCLFACFVHVLRY